MADKPLVTYNTLRKHGFALIGLDVLVVHVAVDNQEIEATKQKGKKGTTQRIRTREIVFAVDPDGTKIAITYRDDALANRAAASTARPGHAFNLKPPRWISVWKQVGLPIFGVKANDTMISIWSTKQYVFTPYTYFADANANANPPLTTTKTYAACLLKDIKVVGLNEDTVGIYEACTKQTCEACIPNTQIEGHARCALKLRVGHRRL